MALGRTSKSAGIRARLDHSVIDADGHMVECGVEEACGLVDAGLLTEADFRDFVLAKPASLYAETDPDFIKGTTSSGGGEAVLNS
jgi:hypothetical protein